VILFSLVGFGINRLYGRKRSIEYHDKFGPGSSVGMATGYGLDDAKSNPGGDEIFRLSRRPWDPPSLL